MATATIKKKKVKKVLKRKRQSSETGIMQESAIASMDFKTNEGDKINVSFEDVSPEKAEKWLQVNTKNRKLDKRLVKSFINKMKNRSWLFNGDTICFSEKGTLL